MKTYLVIIWGALLWLGLSSDTAFHDNRIVSHRPIFHNPIQPNIRSGPDRSAQPNKAHFKTSITPCGSTTPPFSQDFEAVTPPAIPNCGNLENNGQGNKWETYDAAQDNPVVINSKVLRYPADSQHNANVWYFTQGITLEAQTTYQLTYTYANSTINPNFFEKLKVAFGPDSTASVMTVLKDHQHISEGNPQSDTLFLQPTTDGTYYFGFNAYSNFNASDLYLDDITLELGPECPPPTDLYYSDLTDTSVHLSWQSIGNPEEWTIAYGPSGFDPASATTQTVPGTGLPETDLINLSPETTYDVYVRSECDQNEHSDWSFPKTFKTHITPPANNRLCNAISLEIDADCPSPPFSNRGAFTEENEPFSNCATYPAGQHSVWFSFTAPDNGKVTLSTAFFETDFLTEITVYELPEDCTAPNTLGNEIACATFGANLSLQELTPQQTYIVRVVGSDDEVGDFCLQITNDLALSGDVFKNFKSYPNPVSSHITLEARQSIGSVKLYSLSGKQILTYKPHKQKVILSTEDLQSGIYFLIVKIGRFRKRIKLIRT